MTQPVKIKSSRKAFLIYYFAMFLILYYIYLFNLQFKMDIIFNLLLVSLSFLMISHPEWLIFYYTYVIDKDRIIEETGFLSKKRMTIPITSIGHVSMKKSILGRILNYGDIEIFAFGEFAIKIRGIDRTDMVAHKLEEMMKRVGHPEEKKSQ